MLRFVIACLVILFGFSKITMATLDGNGSLDLGLDSGSALEQGVDEALNKKLRKYEATRLKKTYNDKYGMSLERDLDKHSKVDSGNPAFNDQINKSESFKKIYEGPKEGNSYNEQLGFKLSVPFKE